MNISSFNLSTDISEDDFQEYIDEKRIRQDLEKLTVKQFISTLLNTIDKDTTVDMIEKNLLDAHMVLQDYETDRIIRILFMKHSWDFDSEKLKEGETKLKTTEVKL